MADHRFPYQMLLADDDAAFRSTLRSILEPYFRLVEAESGQQAVEIVGQTRVDIALLDMNMPPMTGLETIRTLKSRGTLIPCILVTADATEDLRRAATAAEAYSVLAKPITKNELVSTVSTALQDAYADPSIPDWLRA